jgi:hypothetical protein
MIDLYLAIAAISFLAGLVQGLTGFGSALVAMPLFLLFLDARTAVPLSILNGLIITVYLCLQLKRHLDLEKNFPPAAGLPARNHSRCIFPEKCRQHLDKNPSGHIACRLCLIQPKIQAKGHKDAILRPICRRVCHGSHRQRLQCRQATDDYLHHACRMVQGQHQGHPLRPLSYNRNSHCRCTLVFRPDQRPGITIPGSQRHTGHKRGVVRLAHLFQDNHRIIYSDHTVPAHWHGSAHDRICEEKNLPLPD